MIMSPEHNATNKSHSSPVLRRALMIVAQPGVQSQEDSRKACERSRDHSPEKQAVVHNPYKARHCGAEAPTCLFKICTEHLRDRVYRRGKWPRVSPLQSAGLKRSWASNGAVKQALRWERWEHNAAAAAERCDTHIHI